MKFYDAGFTIFIVVVVVSLIGAVSVKYLGNDNPVKEAAEDIIQIETGKKIDLSPGDEDATSKG
jgi:uncharacterized protein YpmB